MSAPRYYTLVASLPALPYFKHAERLPINRQRLDERLRLLSGTDAAILANARSVVEWGAHSANRTDAEFIRRFEEFQSVSDSPTLSAFLLYRMNLRTVIAALRRRHRDEDSGPSSHPWGIGDWVSHIEINWRVPDFKLGHLYPWIPAARQHLESGESKALEELLMDLVWQNLSRSALGFDFQFEAIIAFVFKWDILERWLSYDPEPSRTRFSNLGADLLASQSLVSI